MMPAQHDSWARWLAVAVLLAALANGAGAYLKRIGLLDHEAYRGYWAVHCATEHAWQEWHCSAFSSPGEIAARAAAAPMDAADANYRHVYQAGPAGRLLKLAKDAVWLLLLAVAAATGIAAGRAAWRPLRAAAPLLLLAGDVLAAALLSLPVHGAVVVLAGLRGLLLVPLALAGRWLAGRIGAFALAAALLLLVQAALVPLELWRGMHIFHEWSPWDLARRAAGTQVQPNSLGVFAACGLAFWYCFAPGRHGAVLLALAFLLVVVASGSGTGMVCGALAGAALLWRRVRARWGAGARHWAWAGGLAFAVAMLLAVPQLSGRDEMFESPDGRVAVLADAVLQRPAAQVLFGQGLGVGTNAALSLAAADGRRAAAGPSNPDVTPTDSTLIGLVVQLGLLGAALFYASLAWAARRDPRARPFYAAVALCSLTINLTELFPVNLLLGLALAHSLWRAPAAQAPS